MSKRFTTIGVTKDIKEIFSLLVDGKILSPIRNENYSITYYKMNDIGELLSYWSGDWSYTSRNMREFKSMFKGGAEIFVLRDIQEIRGLKVLEALLRGEILYISSVSDEYIYLKKEDSLLYKGREGHKCDNYYNTSFDNITKLPWYLMVEE